MALNELKQDRPGNARFFKCPSTVKSGDPVLIGTLAGVALDNYDANLGGTVFRFSGSFSLSVTAATVLSPLSGSAAQQGDEIYADGGSTDATTNVTTGFTLDKNSSGVYFGNFDQDTDLASGTSGTCQIKLKESGN